MIINHTPATVVAELLQANGHGAAPAIGAVWPIYVSHLPDGPDVPYDAICVYDTEGLKDGRNMEGGEVIIHEGIQIRVRSCRYPDGMTKAKQIAAYVDALFREALTVDATDYRVQSITRTTPVLALGTDPQDSKRRHHTSINATTTIEEI